MAHESLASVLDPARSGPSCADLDAFLELRSPAGYGPPDVTAGRVVYRLSPSGGPASVCRELPETFKLREECCRSPEQFVWADDGDRAIVIGAGEPPDGDGRKHPVLWFTAEVWASDDGYHDRLDELAPVAVGA